RSMPWPTRKPPGHESPSRPSESSFSSSTVTSQPDSCSCSATVDPTRPHPITIAFTAAEMYSSPSGGCELLVHDALRERDDQHLAGRAAEDVVDGGREEAGLAAPAGSRAEDDQVGIDLEGVLADGGADRP